MYAHDRTPLKCRCVICNEAGDDLNMLLCGDGEGRGCDRGFHTYCLTPALDRVPLVDWFCPDCCCQHTEDHSPDRTQIQQVRECAQWFTCILVRVSNLYVARVWCELQPLICT